MKIIIISLIILFIIIILYHNTIEYFETDTIIKLDDMGADMKPTPFRDMVDFHNINDLDKGEQAKYKINISIDLSHLSNAHTGNLFMFSQDGSLRLFDVGQIPSPAIKEMALHGTYNGLSNLINHIHNNIGSIKIADVMSIPGQTELLINMSTKNRKTHISFVTGLLNANSNMFICFSFNLYQRGIWENEIQYPLYAYTFGNNVTDKIMVKNDASIYPDGIFKPIGYASVRRIYK